MPTPKNQIPEFDNEETLTKLLEHNLLIQLQQAAKENTACENLIRMKTMDAASKNAQEMTDKLVATYNKTRQTAITTELIDVLSGTQNSKDD
jgi:F-type H+-transporting ATPase subunit gamma